jgi:hypothetical protein
VAVQTAAGILRSDEDLHRRDSRVEELAEDA